jgi:hypothetical protein
MGPEGTGEGLVPGIWIAPTQVATANYKGYNTLGVVEVCPRVFSDLRVHPMRH